MKQHVFKFDAVNVSEQRRKQIDRTIIYLLGLFHLFTNIIIMLISYVLLSPELIL